MGNANMSNAEVERRAAEELILHVDGLDGERTPAELLALATARATVAMSYQLEALFGATVALGFK